MCNNNNDNLCAVNSRNLSLVYTKGESKVFALDNFNITIPVGCIYCLIGPSGCGKTTFLRSLIGLQRLDQGETRLFGYPLGHRDLAIPGHNLGYMPQDVALNDDLTIGEMINYFGRLAGVSKDKIDESKTYYLERLNIPNCSRLIGSLSGGQKRRVSFICTLVHRPKLIILDEPTVGCDPIVIESMWSLLFEVTKEQRSTVILTTHYLEEARKTDTIGFMRKGCLIYEGSPTKVLQEFEVSSIEDAFTKMCKQPKKLNAHSFVSNSQVSNCFENSAPKINSITRKKQESYEYCRIFLAVFSRIFLKFLKLKLFTVGSMIIVCFLTFMTIICICTTPHNLHIGYINYESEPKYSQLFLKSVNKMIIHLIPYNNSEQALADTANDKLSGFFTISPDFSKDLVNLYALVKPPGSPLIEHSSPLISLHGDAIDVITLGAALTYLQKALDQSAPMMMNLSNLPPKLSERFFSVHEPVAPPFTDEDLYNSKNYHYPRFVLAWSFISSLMFSAFIFHRDRCGAMFERNLSAGATVGQLILAHVTTMVILPLINSLPILLATIFIFEVPCKGPFLLVWIIYMICNLTGILTAFLFAALIPDMIFIFVVVTAYIFASIPLTCFVWPEQALPYFMAPGKYMIPLYPYYNPMVKIMVHGASWNHLSVHFSFLYGFVYIILLFSLIRYKLKP